MSWNIQKPGDYINGPLTVVGAATFSGKVTANTNIEITRGLLNDGTSTGVGATALAATTAGATNNTALGYRAMYRSTTGANNVAVGFSALSAAAMTGSGNTALGNGTLFTNVAGSNNTAVGNQALTLSLGSGNIGIGPDAGKSITTGE